MSTPIEDILELAGKDRDRLETVFAGVKQAYAVALRDHFAGLAMQSLLDPDALAFSADPKFDCIAKFSYAIADAMLTARKRGPA